MRFRTVVLLCAVSAASAAVSLGADAAKAKDTAKPAAAAPAATPAGSAPARAGMLGGMPSGFVLPGVPAWTPPDQYSVDMVMTSGVQGVTMHRFFNGGNIRSDIQVDDNKMVMIERADEPGTTYNLMPSEKMAMKMNAAKMAERGGKAMHEKMAEVSKPEPEVTPVVEKIGTETIDGHAAVKFKVSADEHTALAWFDAASGAPLRMESGESRIEWKNLHVEPQSARLFEVPKEYQLIDMDEQMKQMEKMGGSAAMMKGGMGGAALSGLAGARGVPGGMGGVAGIGMGGGLEGMAGGYGQQMGSNFGQQIGSGIGASFGGPIGAMAGQYIGGKVGGWIGHRVATALTPDIGPGSGK